MESERGMTTLNEKSKKPGILMKISKNVFDAETFDKVYYFLPLHMHDTNCQES